MLIIHSGFWRPWRRIKRTIKMAIEFKIKHGIILALTLTIVLLIWFTSAFHFFLHVNDQFQSRILKVVVMMIGENEFEAEGNFYFGETRKVGGRNVSIQFMFVIFIIYGSVIVMNLIVDIVVNR